jgi:uncharacterized damage-inducible protein DinB
VTDQASIDPVHNPSEYQDLVLSFLDGVDLIDAYESLPARLEGLLGPAGERVRVRPAEGEWSALEVLGHIVDGEVASAARLRWVLSEDEPPLPGYDQELWVERQRHNEADPGQLLALLRVLRQSNLALWNSASDEDRARVGMHAERGPESFDLIFRLAVGHGILHTGQMERALEPASDGR